MKDLVLVWLKAGAIYMDGVLLFKNIYGVAHPLLPVLKYETKFKALLLKQLLNKHSLSGETSSSKDNVVALTSPPKPKLREDFAFLSDPDCPNELKILAANKITAYHNYVSGHTMLFDATSKQEQFDAVKFTVENFIENRRIIKELHYYKKHKRILGEHRIFKSLLRLQELRKLKVLDLVKLQKKLERNIWRIKSELAKKDKPHLVTERESSILEKEFELSEIKRLLEGYS